jgi:uroporphyrinogen decarboxylase
VNKRDYVKAALRHEETDKVPYCIRLTSEVMNLYGDRLLEDFCNKEVLDDFKAGLIDKNKAIQLSIGNFLCETDFPWWSWDYGNMPKIYASPLETPDMMPPIVRWDTDENLDRMAATSKLLSEKYKVYTAALIWGSHWEKAYFTRGIENFLADLAGAPEFAGQLLTFIVDRNMEILPKIAGCQYIDGILLGSDWGTQKDLIMSPETWNELIRGGEKRQYELIRSAGKDVMVHSCGNILRLMDDLVDLGVDILNPVQPECMSLEFLKERYGSRITFWGGISTQSVLPYGTPQQVMRETERVITLMSKNGGYITCPSQEIQTDVPYENLKALIETAKSFA